MRRNRRRRNRRKRKKFLLPVVIVIVAALTGCAVYAIQVYVKRALENSPEKLLTVYMGYISERNYEGMYGMIDTETSGEVDHDDFIERNSAIYEGMEVKNMETEILSYDKEKKAVRYRTTFDTTAGSVEFENRAFFVKGKNGYLLVWDDSLIYPGLCKTDKVKVSTTQARRGEILDRNGYVLAGKGVASSVGIVPGRLENRDSAIEEIANLLEMEPEQVEKKLAAKWVKDDYFVPLKTLRKVEEIELMSLETDGDVLREYERQQALLEIPGVMISDTEVRHYPLGSAAAHLIGYVQNVTAEDLEKHAGEGYTANSVIGRSGAESLFEKELKGKDGCRIYIVDADGREKEEVASRAVEHGENIRLTIDSELQRALYEQFREDDSCSVAMNPYTGEVLALLSTPSFDNNDFIMGLSTEKWELLSEDEHKPMYNRFRQTWCPGSTFKPVTAAIGLETGAVNPNEDYGKEGLSWQKDTSWGAYHVTTLHEYEPVILENALIYSDNIYFAKVALKIGAEKMKDSLLELGFQTDLPFEISMSKSQYSNTDNIETEIQLADSGYGQGEILVNPLHMACIYTAFCNEGNILKPRLLYQEDVEAEYWIPGAFSADTAGIVLEGIKKAVNDSHGTGYAVHREDVLLAGKTGTAEIKASQSDTSGTELGWFAVFTAEKTAERPILIVSMVEDVKGRGGSGYVVEKEKQVLDKWFAKNGAEDSVRSFGEKGYAAVDSKNQINMTQAWQVEKFCDAVDMGEKSELSVMVVSYPDGLTKYDFATEQGEVEVQRGYYRYENGCLQKQSEVFFPAESWEYSEEGYLLFEGSYFSQENYVLTLSEASEKTALRVEPLDETCRELNRKYILPVGYRGNNLFLTDWSERDFGDLDFYDFYDSVYPRLCGKADTCSGNRTFYRLPETTFEKAIMRYLKVSRENLRAKTLYFPEDGTYGYRPRGFMESDYEDIPYPEAVRYSKNDDGTITLIVNAVYPHENTSKAFTHKVVVRPLDDGGFQYVSNQMLFPEGGYDAWWHAERLAEEEWEEVYGVSHY